MTWFLYPPRVALDPTTGELAKDVDFLVFAESDTSATSPLPVTDPDGLPLATVRANYLGLTEPMRVENHPAVVLRNGPYTIVIESTKGMQDATEAAATSSAASAESSASSAASAAATAEDVDALREWVDKGVTTRNHAPDPRLTATTMSLQGATVVDTHPTTGAPDGRSYFRRTMTTANTSSPMVKYLTGAGVSGIPVAAGEPWVGSWYARKSPVGGALSRMSVTWYDAAGVSVSTTTGTDRPPGESWGRFEQQFTAPAGAVYVRPALVWTGTALVAQTLDLAMAQFEYGTVATEYKDGDTPTTDLAANRWMGDPNASVTEHIDMSGLVRTVNGVPGPDVVIPEGGAQTDEENVWTAAQIFDPVESIKIGEKLLLRLTDGFFGQRLHLTGQVQTGGATPIMPYMEVAPAADTGVGTDVGGAIAGYQLYRTPGGGGVPDREFLAIEASGDNGTLPGFKISPWASGTGQLRPVAFWDGTHEVFRLHNAGGTGEMRIGTSSRLTYQDTGTTARTWAILQKDGTLGCQYRSYSGTAAVRPYLFFSKNSGTIAAPTAPGTGHTLGDILFGSTDAGTERTGAFIRATTTQAWTYTSAQGAKLGFSTVPAASGTAQVQVEMQEPTANSETGMLLRVDKAGVRTLVRVEIGAPDSGGVGKRALVIPN